MNETYMRIRHVDGGDFHLGAPLTLADAQMLVNEAIVEGRIEAGSSLRIDGEILVIERCGDPAAAVAAMSGSGHQGS